MRALRLCFRAPTAHFSLPFVITDRKTYPIPPYSTVIGMMCNILARRESIEDFINSGFHIAVVGDYESVLKEYTWSRNLSKGMHEKRFTSIRNRRYMDEVEHPGGQSPSVVDVLVNSYFCVYVHSKDEIVLSILESFENGRYISHLHAGRAEDVVSWAEVKTIELKVSKAFHTGGYTWLPSPEHSLDKSEEYRHVFEKIGGIRQKISTIYRSEGVRIFKKIDVKLYKGSVPMLSPFEVFRTTVDFENPFFGEAPVFFAEVVGW